MIRIRDISIRHKLVGAVAISALPALLLSCVALVASEGQQQRRGVERELVATARIFGSSAAAAMRLGDRKGAQAVLNALTAHPQIRSAVLRDERSEIFASYVQGKGEKSVGSSRRDAPAADFGRAAVAMTHEITFEGDHLGTIHLEAGLNDLHPDLAAFLVPVTAVCAGSTLLVLLLSIGLQRLVTRPIQVLTDIAHRVCTKGDFSLRCPVQGNDELGRLAKAFNTTLDLHLNLESARGIAESASRAKSEFLADLSHEMRTPLHAILSFAELGGRRAASLTPEKATRYYKMIEEGGKRLLELLNELIDLARLEAGKRVLRFASAPIGAVVVGVVEESRALFQSRGLELKVGLCEGTSGWIDREALMQVLRYVLADAAKWSVPGGTVTIALVRSERGALLSVTHRGSGIVQAGRDVAFEKILNSESPQIGTGGSGLKLALCRQIMTAHGGRIWAETREGGGGTVYLEIQDRSSHPDEGEAPRSAAA